MPKDHELQDYRIQKLEDSVAEIAEANSQIRDIIVQWSVERRIVMRIAGGVWTIAGLAVTSAAVKAFIG